MENKIIQFRDQVWSFYHQNQRDFAWRQTTDPYRIVVSEIMLQQTQTHRVVNKFEQFITALPTFGNLAQAPLHTIISLWQGLGYNRRALALQKIAQIVQAQHKGILPADPSLLVTFPGIGPNTAGSICAFAFNMPVIFIETNIRAVYIHSFFSQRGDVTDKELLPLIEQTLDQTNPRHWYYALMDYGVYLKKHAHNPSRKSAHHTQQSKFEGSERQIRGMILKQLTEHKKLDFDQLCLLINRESERILRNIRGLQKDGLVQEKDDFWSIE